MSYNEQLNKRFEEWKEKSEFTHFFFDGLMYRGEIANPYWRRSGNENELWEKTSTRVMFLMKDVNAGEDGKEVDDDIRGRIFRDTTKKIYRNMSYWLYGLLKTIENGKIPEYPISVAEATQFFDDTPVAYVNCKKQAGASSVSCSKLKYYIERDKKFIIEEIEILKPDIIICCAWTESTDNPILKFIKENLYQDIKEVNKWMYYSEDNNKLIIDSYHPSTTKSSNSDMYHNMMEAYKEFLTQYPGFKNPCR
jgi:hypothetical protein